MLAGLALAIGGCTVESEADQLEKIIAETLSSQGTVQKVELTPQEDGGMTGFVLIDEPDRGVGRLTCTVAPPDSESNYQWNCSPAIDEKTIGEMEAIVRTELAKLGEVVEVEMQRAGDDDHMSGHAVVRDETGDEMRLACSAIRNTDDVGSFKWECNEDTGEGGAEAV
jgi:hypothetical protein